MATQTKKPVSRAVVGNTKKSKSSKGITKRMALFGVVGLLAFSTLSGLGWQKWQDHQLKAKAAGYSNLLTYPSTNPFQIFACKTAMSGGYGPVWHVTLFVYNGTFTTKTATAKITRYGSTVGSTSLTLGQKTQQFNGALYGSQLSPDMLSVYGNGVAGGSYVSSLTTC